MAEQVPSGRPARPSEVAVGPWQHCSKPRKGVRHAV